MLVVCRSPRASGLRTLKLRCQAALHGLPAAHHRFCRSPLLRTANSIGTYSNPNSNPPKSYTFNANPMTYDEAEAYCQSVNSHLASFATLQEQSMVESFLIDLGVLLPGFHTMYWIGLNTSVWPAFM
jgi:hypothetical protein